MFFLKHGVYTWPYSVEIYRMCKYEIPTTRLSKVIVWQTDRQTRPTLSTTPRRGWWTRKSNVLYLCV